MDDKLFEIWMNAGGSKRQGPFRDGVEAFNVPVLDPTVVIRWMEMCEKAKTITHERVCSVAAALNVCPLERRRGLKGLRNDAGNCESASFARGRMQAAVSCRRFDITRWPGDEQFAYETVKATIFELRAMKNEWL